MMYDVLPERNPPPSDNKNAALYTIAKKFFGIGARTAEGSLFSTAWICGACVP